MPIDFYKETVLDFPFAKLVEWTAAHMKNAAIESYLNKWLKILEYTQQFQDTDHSLFRSKHNTNEKFECFVFTQSFPEVQTDYKFHFDIEGVISRCKGKVLQIQTVTACEYFKYSRDEAHQIPHNEPIIVIPFESVEAHFLVIDGNKRLTTHKKHHIPFISYRLYTPVSRKDFGYAIDWAFFWFFYDVNTHFSHQILSTNWFQEQLELL